MISGKIIKKFNLGGKEIVFRYPRFDDLDGLLKSINSLVEERAMMSTQKKLSRREEMKWLAERLTEIENKGVVFLVVEWNGKIMGSAGVTKRENPPSNHIGDLGISLRKEIRGRGVGKKLIREIIKEAKENLKIKIVVLEAFGENKIAQNLYRKVGFKELGRIKKGIKHYGKYKDRVLMVKYL